MLAPPGGLAPPSMGNTGSAPEAVSNFMIFTHSGLFQNIKLLCMTPIFKGKLEFFLNTAEFLLNSAKSGNLINH